MGFCIIALHLSMASDSVSLYGCYVVTRSLSFSAEGKRELESKKTHQRGETSSSLQLIWEGPLLLLMSFYSLLSSDH